jgi:hypothetical protein
MILCIMVEGYNCDDLGNFLDINEAYGLSYDSQREMFEDANFRIVSEDGVLVDVEDLEMLSEAERLAKVEEGVVVGFSVDEESGVCRMRVVDDK